MATCKAVVQEGARKGESCKFPPSENGYCGRHERNRIYDEGLVEGKHWCRFFFRGCDTELNSEEILKKQKSCSDCREKLTTKKHSCEHGTCPFKVAEPGFCKKHERDKYRKEEQEKGIKYCDIARGCFTICSDGKKKCDYCLDKTRIVESKRYTDRKKLSENLQTMSHTTKRVCTQCGKDFEAFKTRYGKESVKCSTCNTSQAKQDAKRKDRLRNYKEEKSRNIEQYYKDYIKGAAKRGYEMNLDFITFSKMVLAECHYCGDKTEGETNGIDRVDNSNGYLIDNCVTACWKCNKMKHIYNKDFFLEKCSLISKREIASKNFFKIWKQYYDRSSFKNFGAYLKDATKRSLQVEISEEQWTQITRSHCYLCGYQSAKGIGIDRIDNTIRSYTFANSRACCSSCNIMKGEIELDPFISHCASIIKKIMPPQEPTYKIETPKEERKHWKALGLYYAILSDSAENFLHSYSAIYTADEFKELCTLIKESTKEQSIKTLKILLQTLKKRKIRLNIEHTNL